MKTDDSLLTRRGILRSGVLLAAAGSVTPLSRPARAYAESAKATTKSSQAAGFYRFTIGDFKATVISDGFGTIPFWPTYAANQNEADIQEALKQNFLKSLNQYTNNMLVVDTGRERILVDTGFGDVLGPKFGQFSDMVPNLRRAGIAPNDIDIVITTHGHVDHIAGIVDKTGALVFPNARYVFAEDEWSYWTGTRFESDVNGGPMADGVKQATIWAAKTNLAPIRNKVQLVKPNGEVVHGVNLIAAPGHSPAQSAILFTSGNDQLIHMADVTHRSETGLQHPEWSIIFDYDSARAIKTRRALLDRIATDRTLALGYHFPFPAIGHVERFSGAYRWNPASWVW